MRDRTRKLSEKNIVYKRLLPLVTPFHHSCNWLAVRWRLQKNQDNQSFRKLIHFGLECRRATYLLQKYVISSPSENTGVCHSKSIWKVNTFFWNTSSAVCDIPCIKYWQPISAAFPEARFSILFSILNWRCRTQRAPVQFHVLPLLIIGWFWLCETPMSGRNPLPRCFFLFFDSWTGWTGHPFSF